MPHFQLSRLLRSPATVRGCSSAADQLGLFGREAGGDAGRDGGEAGRLTEGRELGTEGRLTEGLGEVLEGAR